jgi:hypothetical protein
LTITVRKSVDPPVVYSSCFHSMYSGLACKYVYVSVQAQNSSRWAINGARPVAVRTSPRSITTVRNVKLELGGRLYVIVGTPDSYSRGIRFEFRPITHVFRGFHQSLQVYTETVLHFTGI